MSLKDFYPNLGPQARALRICPWSVVPFTYAAHIHGTCKNGRSFFRLNSWLRFLWRFPKVGVPLTHPYFQRVFHEIKINKPSSELGDPTFMETSKCVQYQPPRWYTIKLLSLHHYFHSQIARENYPTGKASPSSELVYIALYWFTTSSIYHLKTSINHSFWSYFNQLSYLFLAPTL